MAGAHASLYSISAAVLNVGEGTVFDQITDTAIDDGIADILEASDGHTDNTYWTSGYIEPAFEFTTTNLNTALVTVGIDGYHCSGTDSIDIYLRKLALGGVISNSAAIKVSLSPAFIVPLRLEADNTSAARVVMHACGYDTTGASSPLSITTGQSYSQTVSVADVYKCGPVKLNGTMYGGVQSISCDFGIQLLKPPASGLPWPTYVTIISRLLRINIATTAMEVLSAESGAYLSQGKAITGTTKVFLRKTIRGGGVEAETGAGNDDHLAITVSDGAIKVRRPAASQGGVYTANIEIIPAVADASSAAITIATGSIS